MTEMIGSDVTPQRQILDLLSDGQFHSGEELGVLLGVSRAAVWKHLQKLEVLGIKLVSIKGRGYCIEGGLDLFDIKKINAFLHTALPLNFHLFFEIDSTNAFLMRHANPAQQVCLAEAQSSGRGRRGRTWVSPFAQNIYCSVGWGFEGGVAVLEGLSLAVGLVIVRVLQGYGIVGLKLKWPNDVLYEDRKLAGVLIEITGDPAGYCQVVVGVGINVSMGIGEGKEIAQPWIDLHSILAQQELPLVSRNQLVAALVDELVEVLGEYERKGFAAYCAEWQSFNMHAGQVVELSNGNLICSGVCVGVSQAGALILDTEQGRELFHGGEISLRRADDS